MIPILLLAAGASSRMEGRDKLLEDVAGAPLLRVLADRALSLGPVITTLPVEDHPRRDVLPVAVSCVAVRGEMSDSIKAGIAALPKDATGVIILPADMPDITSADLRAVKSVATTSAARIVRATTQDGKPGHPIYFAASLFTDLGMLTGDTGAAELLKTRLPETRFVPLDGQRARLDLDTPADWDRYRGILS